MEAPPSLKAIKHHLKIASDVESSQPVVAYYLRFYSLQKALEIDKSSPEARTFIGNVMTNLEQFKSKHDDEGLRSDVVGQSIVEGYAHLLFKKADEMDRAGHFTPNLVKLFYTASLIFESLSTFGTVTEDVDKIRKYCKWKAAYLSACLKSGETPVPGPPLENPEFADVAAAYSKGVSPSTGEAIDESALAPPVPKASSSNSSPNKFTSQSTIDLPDVPSGPNATPTFSTVPAPKIESSPAPMASGGAPVKLTFAMAEKAQKHCKFAQNALHYEDAPTAILYLEKALRLLKTGSDE